MGERNFGARWWRESLGIARWATRPAAGTMGLLGTLSLAGCATTWADAPTDPSAYADSRDDVEVNVDALQLQRDQGWDVGQKGASLAFPDSTDLDAAGTPGWRAAMTNLAGALAPTSPALQPFYVPTLFQSLIGPDGQRLRAVMRPMHSAEMDADFARGIALRAQFGAVGWPKDTALVVDAPGPRAVAVAAALADHFTPLFTFGNWPHPLGVVPAHQTLAASLYYLPLFSAAAAARPSDAPPLFVLDANRLSHYGDADTQFDNRYFVKLPTAEQLTALGIRHVLYVGAEAAHELDDLNGALVALCDKGVDVKMVALSDFVRVGDEPAMAANGADGVSSPAGDGDDDGDGDGDGDDERGHRRSCLDVGVRLDGPRVLLAALLVSRLLVGRRALLGRLRLVPAATRTWDEAAASSRARRRRPPPGAPGAADADARRVDTGRARHHVHAVADPLAHRTDLRPGRGARRAQRRSPRRHACRLDGVSRRRRLGRQHRLPPQQRLPRW